MIIFLFNRENNLIYPSHFFPTEISWARENYIFLTNSHRDELILINLNKWKRTNEKNVVRIIINFFVIKLIDHF